MSRSRRTNRRDLLRPVEYLGGAGIAAIFAAAVVLMATRELFFAVITLGVVFIVVLVLLAMFALGWKSDDDLTDFVARDEDPSPTGSSDKS